MSDGIGTAQDTFGPAFQTSLYLGWNGSPQEGSPRSFGVHLICRKSLLQYLDQFEPRRLLLLRQLLPHDGKGTTVTYPYQGFGNGRNSQVCHPHSKIGSSTILYILWIGLRRSKGCPIVGIVQNGGLEVPIAFRIARGRVFACKSVNCGSIDDVLGGMGTRHIRCGKKKEDIVGSNRRIDLLDYTANHFGVKEIHGKRTDGRRQG
mmetsp:Transcript_13848/g.32211  ORF Transcript_13848/g.32211 Transcript_13848/m.32211 type:complete len:205 (-) Transcript_13848:91-705(-)